MWGCQPSAGPSVKPLGLYLFRGRAALPEFTQVLPQRLATPLKLVPSVPWGTRQSPHCGGRPYLLFCLKAFVPDFLCLCLLFFSMAKSSCVTFLCFTGFCPGATLWNRLWSSRTGSLSPRSSSQQTVPSTRSLHGICAHDLSLPLHLYVEAAWSLFLFSSAGQSRLLVMERI